MCACTDMSHRAHLEDMWAIKGQLVGGPFHHVDADLMANTLPPEDYFKRICISLGGPLHCSTIFLVGNLSPQVWDTLSGT